MSLIKEVRESVAGLDRSPKSLRSFGLVVGFVFAAIAASVAVMAKPVGVSAVLGAIGLALMFLGTVRPLMLDKTYTCWMALAFVLGWVMSRVLLSILFFFIVTPIGLAAKLTGKKFMSVGRRRANVSSYWVTRNASINYEKMY